MGGGMTHMNLKREDWATNTDRRPTASSAHVFAVRGRSLAMRRGRQKQISPIRVGLFGLFGNGNSGNDGSLEAMLDFLRQARPDAELTCICACIPGAPERVAADFRL